ncbi:hypothetical protein GCM10010156_14210 [Planobispora rosea]|uniref:Uncharacterized protein n=1 Tax=Planobispora rosea TaxID=35762 RepID=A0A8J3WC62_PLARO|nr:hypothetical protein [Planobispora rosea]GGS56763.1 hypothetical protein GCM10010156_14210 [Planobispora rosea]GIH83507.1 hypothetical protein Pro02_19150 [Planobispora rosea]
MADNRKDETFPPPFVHHAGTTASAWREGALTRIHELESLCTWVEERAAPSHPAPACLTGAARRHLASAKHAAQKERGWWRWRSISGAAFERVSGNCDAAEADLLRGAPDDYLYGQLPNFLAHTERHLDRDDTRLRSFAALAERLGERLSRPFRDADPPDRQDCPEGPAVPPITDAERTQIVAAVRAASSEAGREQMRVRSFRNVLVVTTAVMSVLVVGIAIGGLLSWETVPLCFTPQVAQGYLVVCPTGQTPVPGSPGYGWVLYTANPPDILTVELIGLVAAALAAALSLRNLRGSNVPFGLPVALALLKLPTGALTALLGLIFMRGEFVPGLSALDSPAQILAWAALFGYAQQLLTRLVDQQAQNVLNSVRKADELEEERDRQMCRRPVAPRGRASARPA